jgi:hypothetical protein
MCHVIARQSDFHRRGVGGERQQNPSVISGTDDSGRLASRALHRLLAVLFQQLRLAVSGLFGSEI